ncbi:hypothetical protein ACWGR4_33515 [Embleya sp. NPDC055664]
MAPGLEMEVDGRAGGCGARAGEDCLGDAGTGSVGEQAGGDVDLAVGGHDGGGLAGPQPEILGVGLEEDTDVVAALVTYRRSSLREARMRLLIELGMR